MTFNGTLSERKTEHIRKYVLCARDSHRYLILVLFLHAILNISHQIDQWFEMAYFWEAILCILVYRSAFARGKVSHCIEGLYMF